MMPKPVIAILLTVLLIVSIPVALVIMAIDREPIAYQTSATDHDRLTEMQQLLIDHDPRRAARAAGVQSVRLNEDEFNALLNYSLASIPQLSGATARATIEHDAAHVRLSIPVPGTPLGKYLNFGISLSGQDNNLAIDSLDFGPLDIPGGIFESLLAMGAEFLETDNSYRLLLSLADTVDSISFAAGQLEVTFNWEEARLDNIRLQARQLFIGDEERDRLLFYTLQVSQIVASFPASQRRAGLHDFLQPLFSTALAQTSLGLNPVMENQALWIAMTVYLTDLTLSDLLGPPLAGSKYPAARKMNVTLESRRDLPQHFVVSAAIAASAGAGIADILSVYKEMHDARYESGFSFSDMTANLAGQSLGRLGTQDQNMARRLQKLISDARDETEYMPLVGPEDGMSEEEFLAVYGGIDTPVFRQRVDEINKQIEALPVIWALEHLPDLSQAQ
jgi:hypothetical protein